ncbi:MAG: hypothetical protein QM658_09345 [Gordonia sp. (in: high G+C Gram-positive bacteria)]
MQYLLALLVITAIGVVLWKLVNTPRTPVGHGDRDDRPLGPDDDPDFLRKL